MDKATENVAKMIEAIEETYANMVLFRELMRHKNAAERGMPKREAEKLNQQYWSELKGMLRIYKILGYPENELESMAAAGEDEGTDRYYAHLKSVRRRLQEEQAAAISKAVA